MRSLEADLAATDARIASYRRSLNLPKRIPPEIIQVIFRHCVSFDLRDWDETSSTHNPRRAPLILTQICSSWRQIALDTPSLWTQYVVSFGPEPNNTFIQNVPQMTKFWVARWKSCLGTMSFYTTPSRRAEYGSYYNSIWESLSLEHLAKISTLILHQQIEIFTRFSDLPAHSLSNLESLKVAPIYHEDYSDSYEHSGLKFWSDTTRVFETAPNLRFVDINVESRDVTLLRLPWSQLAFLDLHQSCHEMHNQEDTWDVFQFCKRLEACNVGFSGFIPSDGNIIRFNHLTKFSVVIGNKEATEVFNNIELPFLSEMTVTFSPRMRTSFQTIIDMLCRSQCNLESLSLEAPSTPSDLIRLLVAIPTVSRLRLSRICTGRLREVSTSPVQDLMERLTVEEGIETILPNLQVLYLHDSFVDTHEVLAKRRSATPSAVALHLRNMIKSRGGSGQRPGGQTLHKLPNAPTPLRNVAQIIAVSLGNVRDPDATLSSWNSIIPGFRFQMAELDMTE